MAIESPRELTTRGSAPMRPGTVSAANRTVEAVLSTEKRTLVFDWQRWEPIEEILRAAGAEHGGKVVLLNNHFRYSLDDVFGSIREIRVEGEQVVGVIHFSEAHGDDRIDRAWAKVKDGHLSDVSVGYRALDFVDIEPNTTKEVGGKTYTAGRRTLRITHRWQLKEGSLVPVGADDQAKIREQWGETPPRKEGETMPQDKEKKEGADPGADTQRQEVQPQAAPLPAPTVELAAAPAVDEAQVRAQVVAEEKTRVVAIYELAGDSGDIPAATVRQAIEGQWDITRAQAEFLKAVRGAAPDPVPAGVGIHTRSHDVDCTRAALSAGLITQLGLSLIDPKASDAKREEQAQLMETGQPYRGLSMIDLAREALRIDGITIPASRPETARAAVSSGTLTNIFTTSVNAAVLKGYNETPDSTERWANVEDVNNFMTNERILIGKGADPELLPRGDSAKHLDLGDSAESYRVFRFAKRAHLDEQDIIDDRLQVLVAYPQALGRGAARVRPKLVYALLMENGTMGTPSAALFHADHSNLGAVVLNAANLKAGVTAMRTQTQDSETLDLEPMGLLVPPALDFTARELVRSTQILYVAAGDTDAQFERGNRNTLADLGLQVITAAHLSAGVTNPISGTVTAGSAIRWYLVASPTQANTVTVGYLAGTGRAPVVEPDVQAPGQWGQAWKIKLDIGALVEDFRGLYMSTT